MDLILPCISSASSAVLVNGNVPPIFSRLPVGFGKGILCRSPYSFILCMEYLSVLIHDKCRGGDWKPVYSSHRGVPLTHLFFADDLILFGRVDVETCKTIAGVLKDIL